MDANATSFRPAIPHLKYVQTGMCLFHLWFRKKYMTNLDQQVAGHHLQECKLVQC